MVRKNRARWAGSLHESGLPHVVLAHNIFARSRVDGLVERHHNSAKDKDINLKAGYSVVRCPNVVSNLLAAPYRAIS